MSNFGELFDGKLHYLDPEEDFQIPWLVCEDIVEMEVQHDRDALESPEVNIVTVEAEHRIQMFWKIDDGWSAFSELLRALGKALGGKADAVKTNYWEPEHEPFGDPDEVEYMMRYVREDGWEGGVL